MKMNFKHIAILIIFLLGLNLFTCQDDLELNIQDDVETSHTQYIPPHDMHGGMGMGGHPRIEDDEFDDPILLEQMLNKGKGGQQNGMPQGGPQGGMGGMQGGMPGGMPPGMDLPEGAIPMGGMPMGGMQPGMQPGMTPPNPNAPKEEESKPLNFAFYEIAMFIFLVSFLLNWIFGKTKNELFAHRWYQANKDYIEENYAHVGVNTEYNTKGSVPMMKESYNNFKFYASGRKFVKWLLVNMDFKKRHDLVTMCTSLFLFNEKDRVTYEASLMPPMDLPLVFCICRKKDVKNMKKSYSDIDFFTNAYNPSFMSDNLVFLTEDIETFQGMFSDKEFLSLWSKVQPMIDVIYYTDRQSYTKEENAIFFSFDINGKLDKEDSETLTKFVHLFIDLLCTAKIPSSHRRESERKRIDYDKFRAKELQEKNAEEMRQKKMDKLNNKSNKNLTVEQAQKMEEKNKKEALKDQKKKQFKVIKN